MTERAASPASFYELENVAVVTKLRPLLEVASLTLPPGQVVGLIGHNGSGKSTLLRLLARQQQPSRGRICFEGRELEHWGTRAFARRVAYLPQHLPAAPAMTVRELAALGRYPWHGALGRFSVGDREKVAEALVLTRVEDLADRLVDSLSGGERQRAWLAMLVAQDPRCLLLDEPTAALDIAHQLEVLDLVRRMSRERGISVCLVLHDVNLAARFCDELVALHSGKPIVRGTPTTIMQASQLEAIYGVKMEVFHHPRTCYPVSYIS